jgi:hypothetical protein
MISDTRNLWGWSINRRSTRRWIVVAYWLFVALVVYAIPHYTLRHNGAFLGFQLIEILVLLPMLLGGVRAGGAIKSFRGLRSPAYALMDQRMISLFRRDTAVEQEIELDERETRLRDRVHFVAYTVVRWLAMALVVLYGVFGMMNPKWQAITGPVFLFVIVMVLWGLPQSIILWNEPDVEAER